MGRAFPVAVLAALALTLAPAPAAAQAAQESPTGALAVVYCDDFQDDRKLVCETQAATAWSSATGPGNQVEGAGWFRVNDDVDHDANASTPRVRHSGWFASRPTTPSTPEGETAGYDDNVDVRLVSPLLTLPAPFLPKQVALTIRGSSEATNDVLSLEWAPSRSTPEEGWQSLGSWSGNAQEMSYNVVLGTSAAFGAHRGPFALRVRFDTDADCDSDPTPPGQLPGGAGPNPAEPGAPGCGIGWFVDQVDIIGRRDFTVAAVEAPRIVVDLNGTDASVDLLADRGKLLVFRAASEIVPATVQSGLVRLVRRDSNEFMDLDAEPAADGNWSAFLAVDEPDLVAGEWDVTFFGQTSAGGSALATARLTVGAADEVVPRMTASPAGNPVLLGPGQAISLEVEEAFLRRVTMAFTGLPTPIELPFPYTVPVASFPEGPSTVTFRAEDRTGHVASLGLNVVRDTVRPSLVVLGPPTVYAGVPFDLGLAIVERSAHTIHVDVNGTIIDMTAKEGDAAAGKTTTLAVTPPGLGELTVTTRVVDAFGNEALQVREFVAIEPVTDLRVVDLRLATPATNTAAEGQLIMATIEQVGGVAPLPVTVTFEAGGRSEAFTVNVPASGPFAVPWDAHLPPGVHVVKVNARAPPTANETLPGNENGTMTVESFLGRVVIGSKVYSIRADSRGLPTTAVLSGTSKTYPLALIQSGSGVQYQFTADGNRTVTWDPLVPVATLPAAETATETGKGKDAPFPGLLMALGVLAIALLAQRRRS